MQKITKHIRAGLFGLIILFFLLPFIVISCPNHGSVTVTGVELATGKTIRGSQFSEMTPDQRIKQEPFAILALLCTIFGIIFSYVKRKKTAFILCAAVSILGIIFLLLLRNSIYMQIRRLNDSDDLVFSYAKGYWLSLYCFITVLVVTFLLNPIKRLTIPLKWPVKKRVKRTTTVKKTRKKPSKGRR